MHSRIYELMDERPKENENKLNGGFKTDDIAEQLGGGVDYVDAIDPEDEKEGTIADFHSTETKKGIRWDAEERSMTVVSKKDYFGNALDDIKKRAASLTEDEFENNTDGKVSELKDLFDEEYSEYVYYCGCVMTMDSFVRSYPEGAKYYIGTAYDYHF